MDQLKDKLRQMVLEDIDLCRDVEDKEIYDRIDKVILNYSQEAYISISDKLMLKREIFNSIRRLDILQEFIEDSSITEIMVNGIDNIFYEKAGHIYQSDKKFESVQKLEDVVQQIVSQSNRIINEACPIVDCRLSEELKNIRY